MPDNQTTELAQAIQEVSEKASLLVREEIELAKAEMSEKLSKLVRGAVVGSVAGIFAIFGLIYLLHALAWGIWDLIGSSRNFWLGFAIVAVLLFALGAIAGLIAARALKKGVPPAPTMAIEEGRLIKQTVSSSRPATPIGPSGTVASPTASAAEGRR
jgi:uncharacterized membrane protein YqjE